MSPRKRPSDAPPNPSPESSRPDEDARWKQVLDALRGLRFGQVTIQVQDGVIVQIDRTERKRL